MKEVDFDRRLKKLKYLSTSFSFWVSLWYNFVVKILVIHRNQNFELFRDDLDSHQSDQIRSNEYHEFGHTSKSGDWRTITGFSTLPAVVKGCLVEQINRIESLLRWLIWTNVATVWAFVTTYHLGRCEFLSLSIYKSSITLTYCNQKSFNHETCFHLLWNRYYICETQLWFITYFCWNTQSLNK